MPKLLQQFAKEALSVKRVQNVLINHINSATPEMQRTPEFRERINKFLNSAGKWSSGSLDRFSSNSSSSSLRKSQFGGQIQNQHGIERPIATYKVDGSGQALQLPEAVQRAYTGTTLKGLPPTNITPTINGGYDFYSSPAYDPESHQLIGGGGELLQPSTLFHELGHARNQGGLQRMSRTPGNQMREELAAWRRGSHMYRNYRSQPGVDSVSLPTQRQFLQARHRPLESYRLGGFNDAVTTITDGAPTPIDSSWFGGGTKRMFDTVRKVIPKPPTISPAPTELQPAVVGDASQIVKSADLKPGVSLQPHQQKLEDMATEKPLRMLLLHSLGSGKSLSGIAAAEAQKGPYTVIAPASLRQNYRGELDKFTDHKTPSDVMSYSSLASGVLPKNDHTLIFDEAQGLRNQDTAKSQSAIAAADKAKQLLMLSGTPIVNSPGDLATPMRMLTGEEITPEQFNQRYVKEKTTYPSLLHRIVGWRGKRELDIDNQQELEDKWRGHVNSYDRGSPVVKTDYEDHHVEMSPEQARVYQGVFDKIPWWARYKLHNEIGLTDEELQRTIAFLTGPRQVSLSTLPYMKNHDPQQAFEQSPKLQLAFSKLKETLKDERTKALVFANFIDAGLSPYAAGLAKAGIPHGMFHGGMSDVERKRLVDNYNTGKIRVALLGPSGTEGLSFKGSNLVQLLDPSYQPVRPRQAVGRALRYDSHTDLPPELQNVKVQRFFSRLPMGIKDSLLSRLGFDRTESTLAADDHLDRISRNKEQLNKKFVDLLKRVGGEA